MMMRAGGLPGKQRRLYRIRNISHPIRTTETSITTKHLTDVIRGSGIALEYDGLLGPSQHT